MPDPARLVRRIRDEIEHAGPIAFDRFMELALHDPGDGYYAAAKPRLGPAGDYVTASDAGNAFGGALARQLAEIDERIGPFDPLDVVEFGAGRGLLARDVLDALRRERAELAARVRYRMVDTSAALRGAARAAAPDAEALAPDELGRGHRGVGIAVELFDALPVRRLRRRAGRLVEVRVGVGSRGLVEVEAAAPAELVELAARHGAAADEGAEAEFAPGAGALLETLVAAFERGVLVIVDYGDRAERLFAAHPGGTLLAYHRHLANTDYLERVGEQDLTAHVNFSLLEERARALGCAVVGLTTQDRFLIGNGVLEAFSSSPAGFGEPAAVRRRLRTLALIHPGAMGRRFKVLLLGKGVDGPLDLAGLGDPFER